jgi:nucleobase:cation symporter-1, NCS1 family
VDGAYSYDNGVNPRAMIALVLSVLPVIPGFVNAVSTPGGNVANPNLLDHVYQYAWFVTFALSFVIYTVLMRGRVTLPVPSPSPA